MISGKYSFNLISVFNFLKNFLKRKKNGVPKKVRHSMRSKTWTLYLAKEKCSCLKKLESLKSEIFEKLIFLTICVLTEALHGFLFKSLYNTENHREQGENKRISLLGHHE